MKGKIINQTGGLDKVIRICYNVNVKELKVDNVIMKVKRIQKNLIPYRDKFIIDIWKNHKAELTMTDIAKIFHTDNSIIFDILKKGK